MIQHNHFFHALPDARGGEVFENLISTPSVRIERIVSRGQVAPEHGWFDQEENEWVMVVQGAAELTFDNGKMLRLHPGDYVNIPAHTKHQVSWTQPDSDTVWLAVFYPA